MKTEVKAIYYFILGNIYEYPHPEYAYAVCDYIGLDMKGLKIKYAARDMPEIIVGSLIRNASAG